MKEDFRVGGDQKRRGLGSWSVFLWDTKESDGVGELKWGVQRDLGTLCGCP